MPPLFNLFPGSEVLKLPITRINEVVVVQGLGCLVWQDVAHRVMVVTPQGHSEVKRFWKRQKSHT